MCRIILQSAACCAALPFDTLSYKRHEFRRRFIVYKMCVPILSTVLSLNISHSENNLASYYHNIKQIYIKITFFLRIHSYLNLLRDFRIIEI